MTIDILYRQLIEAYEINNLNRISLTLLNLYKEKQFSRLQQIARYVEDLTDITIESNGKGFSRMIKLYHPDRAQYYLGEIEKCYQAKDLKHLESFSHILRLTDIEEIANTINSQEEIDFSPVYEWDANTPGFSVVDEKKTKKSARQTITFYNFYDAIKIREYGHTDMEFPPYYLEDFDSFEMSASNIDDLDGVQYCLHTRFLDLSDNRISDLSLLEGLVYLEELNLADNQVGIIDSLACLPNLKRVFLANNSIDDISPLLDLPRLEYVDLTGNPVSQEHIDQLSENNVGVEF